VFFFLVVHDCEQDCCLKSGNVMELLVREFRLVDAEVFRSKSWWCRAVVYVASLKISQC
jgi:hypothetical protein